MQQFKQNQTTGVYTRIYMFLASPADGYTPVTSLSGATVNLFKNGVAFGTQPTTPASLTHIQNGHWYYQIDSSFLTDLGILTVTVQDANIRTVVLMAQVISSDPYTTSAITAADVWAYATRELTGSVAVASIANNAITAASITDGVIASEVWDAALSAYTTNNTFGQRVLRSTTSQSQCAVTGSNHIAADVHELQAGVISSGDFAADAIDANALATDAVTEIADGVLGRNIGSGSNAGALNERTVRSALRVLRNKTDITGSTLSVYDEDDTHIMWTATVTSSATADPVTGVDPV